MLEKNHKRNLAVEGTARRKPRARSVEVGEEAWCGPSQGARQGGTEARSAERSRNRSRKDAPCEGIYILSYLLLGGVMHLFSKTLY